MTALALTENTTPSSKTTPPPSPVLSGPIKCWLLDETSDQTAIKTIAASEILRREAEDVMPALKTAALRPATRDEIERIIGQRFELFPQPKRDAGQWAAWWADYVEVLDGLTPFAIEAGMAAWVRSPEAEFMVKPGKLAELAKTAPSQNRWAKAYYRAERATAPIRDFTDPPQPKSPTPATDRPSPEAVAALMAEFHKVMQDKDPIAKMQLKRKPPPCAKVDETGVSAEMRELWQRQAQQ